MSIWKFFLAPSPRSIPHPVSEKNGPPGAKKMRPPGSRFCARKMGAIFGARKRSPRGQHNHGARKWSRFLRPDSGHKNGPRGPPQKEAPRPKKWCAQKQEIGSAGGPDGRSAGRSVRLSVGRRSAGEPSERPVAIAASLATATATATARATDTTRARARPIRLISMPRISMPRI